MMFTHIIDNDLELRLLEMKNAEDVYQLVITDKEYLKMWLPWVENTTSVDYTKGFIKTELMRFANNNGFTSGIFYKNQFAGCIGIHEIDWNHRKTSLGYWIGKRHQGLGLITRSCKEIIRYCFEELDLNRVEIRACKENLKSRAIPERLGFQFEGTIREAEYLNNEYFDHVIYGMIKSEWKIDK